VFPNLPKDCDSEYTPISRSDFFCCANTPGDPVEVLDLRHFSSIDLRPMLQDEIQMWSRLLSWDYSGSAEMILRYVDSRILPGYAAVERGRVIGYAFFVYEGSKGVIGDLYVADERENEERRAIESRLLLHVIETLQQSPGIHRIEAQLLAHETGTFVHPFVEQGFQQHPRLFMVLPLDQSPQTKIKMKSSFPPEIEVRRWAEQDYQAAAALITAAYRDHVDADINDQYRTLAGSLRFLNNIVRFPGCGTFDPESSFVAWHKPTRSMVAAILCSRVRGDVGHITQICVLPEYRSRGIGEALLATTVNNLRQRNFTLLSLTVTQRNEHAVKLYRRFGFKMTRVFDAFVWTG
jgi:ribosomal protein S18 acetylase RimI-like enzyme